MKKFNVEELRNVIETNKNVKFSLNELVYFVRLMLQLKISWKNGTLSKDFQRCHKNFDFFLFRKQDVHL